MPVINGFTFDIPYGFIDTTNYTYRARERPEELSVIVEPPTRHEPSEQVPSSTIARMRRRAEGILGDRVAFIPMGSTSIGGRVGQCADVVAGGLIQRITATTTPSGLSAVIVHASSTVDPYGPVVFAECIASVRFETIERQPAPGYFRVSIAGVSLDVPTRLSPPSVLVYLSPSELVRICVTVPEGVRDIQNVVASGAAMGRPYVRDALVGEQINYVTSHCDREYCVHRVVVAAPSRDARRYLSIECRGPREVAETDVDAAFAQILATVRT